MYRVLVVDDHHIFRATILAFLQTQPDVQVIGEAKDGREAVDMSRSLEPDIVVMDVSMPVMNGIEATRLIKQEQPEVRVIGLSAFDEPPVRRELEAAGAESCLSKSAFFLNEDDRASSLMSAIRRKP